MLSRMIIGCYEEADNDCLEYKNAGEGVSMVIVTSMIDLVWERKVCLSHSGFQSIIYPTENPLCKSLIRLAG